MPTFSNLVPREEIEAKAAKLHKERIERERPPVLLVEEDEEPPAKKESVEVVILILADPSDVNSETNYINFRYFKQGTPERCLKTQEDLEKIFEGQNVNTPAGKFCLVREFLKGDTLWVFDLKARSMLDADGNVFVPDDAFDGSMMTVTQHIFPRNALGCQKR